MRHCDQLILMDQGQVKATGSFEQLAEDEPMFIRMIETATINSDNSSTEETEPEDA